MDNTGVQEVIQGKQPVQQVQSIPTPGVRSMEMPPKNTVPATTVVEQPAIDVSTTVVKEPQSVTTSDVSSEKQIQSIGSATIPQSSAPAPSFSVPSAPPEVLSANTRESISAPAIKQEAVQPAVSEILKPSVPPVVEVAGYVEASGDTSLVPSDIKKYIQSTDDHGIPVAQNDFGIKSLPESYATSVEAEKKYKISDAGRWVHEKVQYLWRKINPTIYK